MAAYIVEVYRPAYPDKRGVSFEVTRETHWNVDSCSPCMTALFRVDCCKNKNQAVALCLEKLAGKPVSVIQIA